MKMSDDEFVVVVIMIWMTKPLFYRNCLLALPRTSLAPTTKRTQRNRKWRPTAKALASMFKRALLTVLSTFNFVLRLAQSAIPSWRHAAF